MEESDKDLGDRPLYGKRRKRLIRAFVLITVGAMMLPVLANLYAVNSHAATKACVIATIRVAPDATGAAAHFELFGPGVIGWECYATGTFGGDRHIVSLGLFPASATLPDGGVQV